MQVIHSRPRVAIAPFDLIDALADVSAHRLQADVFTLAVPRHRIAEHESNEGIARFIAGRLRALGYMVTIEGIHGNVVARPAIGPDVPVTIVGAHFDSVPGTPGADDNASAVAGMLECARAIARHAPALPIGFVAFNGEEDGMLGSTEFVAALPDPAAVARVHILEMIGYRSTEPNSQLPLVQFPIGLPTVGDFLGLLGNSRSSDIVAAVIERAKVYAPDLPVVGLKVFMGMERLLPVLHRSDHSPFWQAGIPAVLWTDTAEFRNPNELPPTHGHSGHARLRVPTAGHAGTGGRRAVGHRGVTTTSYQTRGERRPGPASRDAR